MSRLLFSEIEFISSAANKEQFPLIKSDSGKLLPEVAIVGRSNVGKSSLLNYMFKRKNLARVSATPGKTQLINFFKVDKELVFVDLPGYGYAKVPKEMRADWGPLIQSYLDDRKQLALILYLFDMRRDPTDEDRELVEWFNRYQKPFMLVFTKKDKINKSSLEKRKNEIIKGLPESPYTPHLVSSTNEEGKENLIFSIKKYFKEQNN